MKDDNLWVRLSVKEKVEIKKKAAMHGMTPSAYARMILKYSRVDMKIKMKGDPVSAAEKKALTGKK